MSSEIRVIAVVQGKPGTADAIEQALLRCVAPSRAETGCLLYTPHRDLNRADQFVFFERWASREALAEHERTEHFKQLVRELTPLVVKPLDVTILEALLDDGVRYIAARTWPSSTVAACGRRPLSRSAK